MKILILSCFTGEGHNSAARAVAEAFTSKGMDCEIADPVAFRSDKAQHFISSFYNNMIQKRPYAFGMLYKAGDIYSSSKLPSPVYYANSSYSSNLRKYILENRFDAVVCTHLYGMEAMTAIRKRHPDAIPCFGILTDYTCIPFISDTKLDMYFAPHQNVEKEMIQKGLPKDKIICTGIPVSARFNQHLSKEEARRMVHLPQNKKIFLIMTGGIGCENMLELCDEAVNLNNDEILTCILTGHNDVLRSKIDEKYGHTKAIRTVSFTDKVNLYMKAADVLMSKPGGLSSTEAAVANVPFICVNAIPGCETRNAAFFSENGMAYSARDNKQALKYAISLVYNNDKSDKMLRRQQELINPYAAEDIVERVVNYGK